MKKLNKQNAVNHGLYFWAASFMKVKPEIMMIRGFLEGLKYLPSSDSKSGQDYIDSLWDSPEAKAKAIKEHCKKMYGENG